MRQAGTLTWLLGDHLGSTTITATENGTLASEQKYTAWGQTRSGSVGTDRQYTGQISEPQLGIYFYNARYYDPYISRFISADTIIPQPGNPMAWDRYSYTYNNPVKYNDPSGNKVCEFFDKDGNCNQVVFYLVCGFGTNGNCSQNKRVDGYQGVPLAPYAKHAREEGYQVRYFDFNGDSKPGAKVRMSDTMISYLNKHPNDLPMIIGHSAGADAILLTFGNMSSDQKGRIGGVVLLDPTLTAGPDYSDEGSLQGFVIEMLGIGIPVHVADGIGAGSDQDSGINIDKFLDPEGKDVFNQFSDIYTYKPYPGMNHLILATDLTVFENSLSVLK